MPRHVMILSALSLVLPLHFSTLSGADSVVAGGGDDTIYTYSGNDSLDGGEGTDFGDEGSGTDACLSIEQPTGCESAPSRPQLWMGLSPFDRAQTWAPLSGSS